MGDTARDAVGGLDVGSSAGTTAIVSIEGSEGDAVGTYVESSSSAKTTTTKSRSAVTTPVSMSPVVAIACASISIPVLPFAINVITVHTRNK